MKLSGNTVLITGGATGLGLAMAEAFVAAGSEVAICGRREARLREAKEKVPALRTRACDVGDVAQCRALAGWAARELPRLNVLVNNAGIQRDVDFTNGAEAYLAGESELRVNLEAPIVLAGLFVPQLAGRPGAAIVNVTSGLGFVPAARMPVYSATKAGLHAFTLALRHQLARANRGIEVIEVVPPAVDTELNAEGRAARGGYRPDLGPAEFTAGVMKALEAGQLEIGYGTSAGMLRASRDELDRLFQQMNARW